MINDKWLMVNGRRGETGQYPRPLDRIG